MKRAASSAEPESYDTISDEDDSSVSSTDGKPSYVTNEPLETTRNDQTREETREKSETSSINETSLPPAGDPDEMADESIGDSESSPVSNKKQRRGKPVIKDGKPYGLLQAKWDEMFARLEAYKAKHGNCLVPNRYKGDASLGAWVSTQRRQYKILTTGSYESTPMTPDRAQRLEALGFIWATKDPRHVPWERRFQELVAFKKKYGHCSVPIGYERNVKLANWVSTQRQEAKLFREGRSSRLDATKMSCLDKIGFVWKAPRGVSNRVSRLTTEEGGAQVMLDNPPLANQEPAGALQSLASARFSQSLASARFSQFHVEAGGRLSSTTAAANVHTIDGRSILGPFSHSILSGGTGPQDRGAAGGGVGGGQMRLQASSDWLNDHPSLVLLRRNMTSASAAIALALSREDENSQFLQTLAAGGRRHLYVSGVPNQQFLFSGGGQAAAAALSSFGLGGNLNPVDAHAAWNLVGRRNQNTFSNPLVRTPHQLGDLAFLDPFLAASLMQAQHRSRLSADISALMAGEGTTTTSSAARTPVVDLSTMLLLQQQALAAEQRKATYSISSSPRRPGAAQLFLDSSLLRSTTALRSPGVGENASSEAGPATISGHDFVGAPQPQRNQARHLVMTTTRTEHHSE